MGRKQLYESIQALEAKINSQNRIIEGLSSYSTNSTSKINPMVVNSANYSVVLSVSSRIIASNRYITDIPDLELPSQKLELLWYVWGSLGFSLDNGKLIVSSYSKTGDLNGIGDLTEVYPISFDGKTHSCKKTVVYTDKNVSNPMVIINDYNGTYLENQIIPRCSLDNVSINDQVEIYAQLKNSIILTAKKAIAFIEDPNQRDATERRLMEQLQNNSPVMSIVGKTLNDAHKLFNIDTKLDIEGYLRAIETYDKMRNNDKGVRTRSKVEKKERLITSETENDNAITDLILYDGLMQRQIGIELMKKHSLIKEGSSMINPKLKEIASKLNGEDNTDKSDSTKMEKR